MHDSVLRVVVDSNGLDPIVKRPDLFEPVQAAVDDGRLDMLATHVLIDELASTPALDLRQRLLLAAFSLCRLVPTGVMVLGVSRLGHCRLGEGANFERLRSSRIENSRDAVIASTAEYERCDLLTNDGRLQRASVCVGIRVWTTVELLGQLEE